jgi:transmembrane sensor
MDDLSKQLKTLGEAVSDTVERTTDPGELGAARKLWLQSPARAPSRARRPLLLAVAACSAALILGLAVRRAGLWGHDRAASGGPVSFAVGAAAAPGVVGDWVAAERGAPLPVQFSEGTGFTLAPGARVRVTDTTARGATVLLERGDVAAAVVHGGTETSWDVLAGPFDVHVTGTKFDASWDPTGETFTLAMQEGVVVVKGPLLAAGRELRAGERLRVSVRDGSMELRTASSGEPSPIVARNEAPAAVVAPAAPPDPPVAPGAPASAAASAPAAPHEPSVHDLAAAGKYDEALAAAERGGFAQEIDRASSQDLATLADAARYAGKPSLARQAVLAQRRRFGARGSSAFVLGKIAADQQGASADAVTWFETYLREEPNGALAEQALGRILELKKNNPAAARATAERYLSRYPTGVHAALARSLLSP